MSTEEYNNMMVEGTPNLLKGIHSQLSNHALDESGNIDAPRILYIEDDPIIRFSYRTYLSRMGYFIDETNNGQDALDKYHQNIYDLILLDGGLPDISGFEVGRRIRSHEKNENGPRLPLLLLSAYPQEIVSEECLAADIDAFKIKPISFQDLHQLIFLWLPKNKSKLLGLRHEKKS